MDHLHAFKLYHHVICIIVNSDWELVLYGTHIMALICQMWATAYSGKPSKATNQETARKHELLFHFKALISLSLVTT